MKHHILLVDDHRMAREALKLFLQQEGFSCEEADNGRSALEQLEAGLAVDLIISDNQMPGMTGMEFLTKLKDHAHLSSIPFILYSGNITEDVYTQAQQVGVNTIFPKPYNFVSLLEIVKKILSSS